MVNVPRAIDSARKAFSKRGGVLRTKDALRLGIHPRTLYKLRDQGELERVGRGLYRLSNAPHLTNPDWVTVAIRAPHAVVCLISALAHHGLTTQVPHSIDLDRKSTRLNSSHLVISYAVFCLKKKNIHD